MIYLHKKMNKTQHPLHKTLFRFKKPSTPNRPVGLTGFTKSQVSPFSQAASTEHKESTGQLHKGRCFFHTSLFLIYFRRLPGFPLGSGTAYFLIDLIQAHLRNIGCLSPHLFKCFQCLRSCHYIFRKPCRKRNAPCNLNYSHPSKKHFCFMLILHPKSLYQKSLVLLLLKYLIHTQSRKLHE